MVRHNRWSKSVIALWLLCILLFLIIVTGLWLIFIYPSSYPSPIGQESPNVGRMAQFTVTSSKSDLEIAANRYLETVKKPERLSFRIALKEELEIHGGIRVLGKTVGVTLKLDSVLQKNGDLTFQLHTFHVGGLPLPGSALLQYLRQSYDFPEWIVVQPAEKAIHLDISQWNIDHHLKVRIDQFDIMQDRFKYEVYLPAD